MTEEFTSRKLIKYTKYDDTPSWIQVEKSTDTPLGGVYGMIHHVDTIVLGRPRRFVLKRFIGTQDKARANAERAFDNYRRAKKAGLKVFPTYRLGEDRTSILMTDGNANSTISLSNNRSLPELGLPPIRDEALPPSLTDEIIEHAKLAAGHKILIPSDAYFFLYHQGTQKTDFVLGDLDKLGVDVQQEHALWHNLKTARSAMLNFIASNAESPYLQFNYIDKRFRVEGETGN